MDRGIIAFRGACGDFLPCRPGQVRSIMINPIACRIKLQFGLSSFTIPRPTRVDKGEEDKGGKAHRFIPYPERCLLHCHLKHNHPISDELLTSSTASIFRIENLTYHGKHGNEIESYRL